MEGRVEVQFVIEPNGVADPSSVMVVWASTTPFARAALEVLPGYQFKPAMVSGCAARMLVKLPFEFRLRRLSPF
jgi:TonB family protein